MSDMADAQKAEKPREDAVQKLVYGISHDLGAPLRAIVQFSRLLEQRLDQQLDDKARYWLRLIHDGGSRAQDMIDALLRYSRLSTRMSKPARFSLHDLALAVIDEQINRHRHAFPDCTEPDYAITSTLPQTIGVREHWHLLLSCIIENALLFQPKDQPNHIPRLQISCDCADGKVRIAIEDNGIGVAEDRLADITRPFLREQREEDYPGLGMGLSYCERIAQLHGAHLAFDLSSLGGLAVTYTYGSREAPI